MTDGFDPKLLDAVGRLPLAKLLYRGVRLNTLMSKVPPQPLFAGDSPGRYNAKGIKTLYFGENVLTAYAETVQEPAGLLVDHPTRERVTPTGYDIADEGEEPIVVFAVRASLEDGVLDLTDPGVRSKLAVTEDSILTAWRWQASLGREPLCRRLGDAVHRSGRFEAIRFPSHKAMDPTRPSPHAALAIFVDHLGPQSFLQVSDVSRRLQGRLP